MSRGREKKEFSRRKQSRGKTTASWRLARRAVRNPFAQHAARFRLLTIRLACGRMKPKLKKKGAFVPPLFCLNYQWILRARTAGNGSVGAAERPHGGSAIRMRSRQQKCICARCRTYLNTGRRIESRNRRARSADPGRGRRLV